MAFAAAFLIRTASSSRRRPWLGVLCFAWSLALALSQAPQPVRAQADPPAYRAAVDEAMAEYELRHFAEARALFARAHQIQPNARTLRGLGVVAFELRMYVECTERLAAALASRERPLTGDLRRETERLLARASQFVSELSLSITPADTGLSVDGGPYAPPPTSALKLQAGDHVLELRAKERRPERHELTLIGGERTTLRITLEPLPPPMPTATLLSDSARSSGLSTAPRSDAHEPPSALRKNPWLWAGVATVAAGAALALGLTLRDRKSDHEPFYGGDSSVVFIGP